MKKLLLYAVLSFCLFLSAAGQVYRFDVNADTSGRVPILAGLAFLEDGSLVGSRCDTNGACKLFAFAVEMGTLRKLNETPADLIPSSRIYASGPNHFIGGDKLYNIRTLRPEGSIPISTTIIANDGESFGVVQGSKWCVAKSGDSKTCAVAEPGRLLALSSTTAVVERGRAIQIRNLKDPQAFASISAQKCPVRAVILKDGEIGISQCQETQLLTPAGQMEQTLKRVVVPFDDLQSDVRGKKLLVATLSRNPGKLRAIREGVVAVATLGAGVQDDTPNSTQVEVSDRSAHRACFSKAISYADYREKPEIALSDDGHWLAIGDGTRVQLIDLFATCTQPPA